MKIKIVCTDNICFWKVTRFKLLYIKLLTEVVIFFLKKTHDDDNDDCLILYLSLIALMDRNNYYVIKQLRTVFAELIISHVLTLHIVGKVLANKFKT